MPSCSTPMRTRPGDLLVGEHLDLGQPVQALRRHAVGAAQVAAVGQRDPQIGGHPAVPVDQAAGARGDVAGRGMGRPHPRVGQRVPGHGPNVVRRTATIGGRGSARSSACYGSVPPPERPAEDAPHSPVARERESNRVAPHRLRPLRPHLRRRPRVAGVLLRRLAGPAAHADPRSRRRPARRGRDRQLRPGRRRRRHARAGRLAGQPAVGARHGPARPGRRPADGLHRLPRLRGRVRRRRRPRRAAVVVVRPRRADRRLRPEHRLDRAGPLGRRPGRRRAADRVRVRVGRRRGGLRRRPAAGHASSPP